MSAAVSTAPAAAPSVRCDSVKPAARVWSDPMPTDRKDQVEFFRREGFFILRNVLTAAELQELDREIDRMASNL